MTKEENKLLTDSALSDAISEKEYREIKGRLDHPSEVIRALEMGSIIATQAYKARSN